MCQYCIGPDKPGIVCALLTIGSVEEICWKSPHAFFAVVFFDSKLTYSVSYHGDFFTSVLKILLSL